MNELLQLVFIKHKKFADKYNCSVYTIDQVATGKDLKSYDCKLKILSWIRQHIDKIEELYAEEKKAIIDELFLN